MIYDVINSMRYCKVVDRVKGVELDYVVSVDTERNIVTRVKYPLEVINGELQHYETPCANIDVTLHARLPVAAHIELDLLT